MTFIFIRIPQVTTPWTAVYGRIGM